MILSPLVVRLVIFHCFIIAISNYLAQFPLNLFGFDVLYGTLTFPFIILATDLTVRLSNSANARKIIGLAFLPAFIISWYLSDIRIATASVSAYAFAQFLDIYVFSRIRKKLGQDQLRFGPLWFVAPVVSTFFAQIIDTYVFYGVAFYNSSDAFMNENWFPIATNNLIYKLII